MPHYLTIAEAERAVGGAHELKELLPRPGYATADEAMVEDCLAATDGDVRRWIGLSFDLDSFDATYFNQQINDTPPPARPMTPEDRSAVRAAAQDLFADYAWDRGAKKLAKPAQVTEKAKSAVGKLEAMGKRLQDLGSRRKPGTDRGYRMRQPGGVGEYNSTSPLGKWHHPGGRR